MNISCFIFTQDIRQVRITVQSLRLSGLTDNIFLLSEDELTGWIDGCTAIQTGSLHSAETVRKIAELSTDDYTLVYTRPTELNLGMFALDRMIQIADDSGAGMVYADYCRMKDDGVKISVPLIAYQEGSLRDDFNFGSLLLYNSSVLKKAAVEINTGCKYAALYSLRLNVSRYAQLVHINEYLYTENETGLQNSDTGQFAYVDPKNREIQIEMEAVCAEHLRKTGAYLNTEFKTVDFAAEKFNCEASVIIPVRNRVKTVADAIRSVLVQKTRFKFNLIVINNYSTDGTTEVIDRFLSDERLIHIVPENRHLGIGGCWNAGIFHPQCGKFAIQLDSDDVYSDENTLQKIVDAFYNQNCAMIVGSYMLTDFNLKTIPPGIIDHREWTPENGHNNALRINGFGAPRAFYTPILRKIKFPNTSYGEDYALGLALSREYRTGRIYDVLYLCRRWDDNSDAAPDTLKTNTYNIYKDRIRTWEIEARKRKNAQKSSIT